MAGKISFAAGMSPNPSVDSTHVAGNLPRVQRSPEKATDGVPKHQTQLPPHTEYVVLRTFKTSSNAMNLVCVFTSEEHRIAVSRVC